MSSDNTVPKVIITEPQQSEKPAGPQSGMFKRNVSQTIRAEGLRDMLDRPVLSSLAHDALDEIGKMDLAIKNVREKYGDDPETEVLDIAVKKLETIARNINDLLDEGALPIEQGDVYPAIERAIRIVTCSRPIRCFRNVQGGIWRVALSNHQLIRVMINLLLNACETGSDTDTVSITARNFNTTNGLFVEISVSNGFYVISDQGMPYDSVTEGKDPANNQRLDSIISTINSCGGVWHIFASGNSGNTVQIIIPANL